MILTKASGGVARLKEHAAVSAAKVAEPCNMVGSKGLHDWESYRGWLTRDFWKKCQCGAVVRDK
jgi:hypothetical protein